MASWRLDGKSRTARRFSVYQNCPLPPPEDRLFFILTYLKTYALQVVQGRLFGMRRSRSTPRPAPPLGGMSARTGLGVEKRAGCPPAIGVVFFRRWPRRLRRTLLVRVAALPVSL